MTSASDITADRSIPWDWYPGRIPTGVVADPSAYIETSFSFLLYRSAAPIGLTIGRGASTYLGTMFDIGVRGSVAVGEFTLLHGVRVICDAHVEIGDYSLLSWNVVVMDTDRASRDVKRRRDALEKTSRQAAAIDRMPEDDEPGRPVRIGSNVWIGFDVCVMPGVTIGEGSIVGAKSVVFEDIPPYTIVAGNPARQIRSIGTNEVRAAVAREREALAARLRETRP